MPKKVSPKKTKTSPKRSKSLSPNRAQSAGDRPMYVCKEKPAVLKLLARGLKKAESKNSKNKWGEGNCDVLYIPGKGDYPSKFYEGTITKYARALGYSGECCVRKECLKFLKEAELGTPAGVLVSFGEPKPFDHWHTPPALAVRGVSAAAQGGNWVYPVSDVKVLSSLPGGLKEPGLNKALVPLNIQEWVKREGVPADVPTREQLRAVAQITMAPEC